MNTQVLKFVDPIFSFLKSNSLLVYGLAISSLLSACSFLGVEFLSGKTPQYSLNDVRCLDIEDQAKYFYESSGFRLPADSQIIMICDDHSGFHGDGEYYMVFEANAADTAALLKITPWNTTWKRGPVPQIIRSRTALSRWDERTFNSESIWYAAEGNNSVNSFHNGRLIIVDLERSKVFYSQWDF